jgi:glycosyltransferase involved in cell wall biosynthesis
MNILMLRPQIELGGVTAYIKLLSQGLVARGHQVRVATGGGALARSLGEMGLPVATLPLYPSTLPHLTRSALQLRRFVRTHHVDLLHSHHRFTTIVGRFVQRLVRVPLIATIHEFKDDGRLTARLWARNITIVPSQALKDHLVTLFQANAQDIFVIPYGIDLASDACVVPANPPIAPALHANDLSVGYIGRLSPEKGARYFLESIPLISPHWPNIRWVVVGDGPEASQLRQLADHLGLDAAQLFLGARNDIDALIKTLDIVVIPSLSDNFPMVALEAMRAGRAVVAT